MYLVHQELSKDEKKKVRKTLKNPPEMVMTFY